MMAIDFRTRHRGHRKASVGVLCAESSRCSRNFQGTREEKTASIIGATSAGATKIKRRYYDSSRWKCILRDYGLTKEQYEQMERDQDFKCAICDRPESFAVKGPIMTEGTVRRLAVDHCHDGSKKIRGLLCTRCNQGLGNFKDDIEVLKRAAAYLEKHKEG